jgi:hypothetical protein
MGVIPSTVTWNKLIFQSYIYNEEDNNSNFGINYVYSIYLPLTLNRTKDENPSKTTGQQNLDRIEHVFKNIEIALYQFRNTLPFNIGGATTYRKLLLIFHHEIRRITITFVYQTDDTKLAGALLETRYNILRNFFKRYKYRVELNSS